VVPRVCLQGGAEFGRSTQEMDAQLLKLARPGPVVIAPLASPPGSAYQRTGAHAVGYFGRLGAASALVAADAREDDDAACATVAEAGLLVLPGGSPARLLDALTQSRLGLVLRDLIDDGAIIMGASAGAMCLAAWTLLPDRGAVVAPGIDVVPAALVLPHYEVARQEQASALLAQVPPQCAVLGIPEQSGVLFEVDDVPHLTAMGAAPTTIVRGRVRVLEVGDSVPWPMDAGE
jgi:cyanophycinase-like exopeptidase